MDADQIQQSIGDLGPLWAQLKDLGIIAKDAEWGTAAGLLIGLGAVLTGAINLYRGPTVQALAGRLVLANVPWAHWLVWDNLPTWARMLAPTLGSALPAMAGAAAGLTSWPVALAGAVVAAVSSVGAHHLREILGSVATPVTHKLPGPARAVTGIMLKIDPSKIPVAPNNDGAAAP